MNTPPEKKSRRGTRARSIARKLAMQALYQWQMTAHEANDITRQFVESEEFAGADREYFEELLQRLYQRQSADQCRDHAVHRSAARAARSGRNGDSHDRHVRAALAHRCSISGRHQRSGRSRETLRRDGCAQVCQCRAGSSGERNSRRGTRALDERSARVSCPCDLVALCD